MPEPDAIVLVVDDDVSVREALGGLIRSAGLRVEAFASAQEFLAHPRTDAPGCLVLDMRLPDLSGLDLQKRLAEIDLEIPIVFITGHGDVPTAVQAMKAGASDFIEKPISRSELLSCVDRALELARDAGKLSAWREDAATHIAGLTPRQRQVMDMVLAGHPSKNIAADLGISQRTVENHRASIMTKTGTRSLPALARLALAAAVNDGD